MAKSNLLKTQDTTFLELIGNGKTYEVPAYQRDYSWEVEQWEDLWNDIRELETNQDSRHYMGALVVEAVSDRKFLVIDGQQRIATLSVLTLAAISILIKQAQDERAERLRNRFIGEKDPASLLEASKLVLNETDNAFYQDYLVQLREHSNPRGLTKSNKLLWDCFCWFRKRLEETNYNGEAVATLIAETVARKLLFILITVEDSLSAFTVFETLNARGLELSSTDLLKNYLFSKVSVKTDLEVLQRRWRSLIAVVKQERFPDFLRYHMLCDSPQVRKQRLFKLVREKIRTTADVFDLMVALESRAELFSAIGDPEHEYWLERHEAKPFIRELQLFKVRQMTPLLFAAWEKLEPQDFVRALKLTVAISFRYTIICHRNTNELEPAYHHAAKALLDGRVTTPAQVFEHLRDIYIPDERFSQSFETIEMETSGQKKKMVKYILCRLEENLSGRACDYETDTGSIEHIFPENPTAEWDVNFNPQRQKDFVYRLGNLTLLEKDLNRECGNQLFVGKLTQFAKSKYATTLEISSTPPNDWTPPALEARQKSMAKRAAQIWKSDFA